jgi:gluconolactonase
VSEACPHDRPARLRPAALAVGLSVLFAMTTSGQAPPPTPTPTVERLASGLDQLIASNATFEKLTEGYAWVEGPVWSRKGGFLLFSDIPNNVIQQWTPGGAVQVFLKPSGYDGTAPFTGREPGSNGLTFDHQGRLVMCQHGNRRIARRETDGSITALADQYQGKRLNSPNDLVYHSSGALYFTDPPYGLPKQWDDPQKELPFQGVYRLATDGTLTLLTKELYAPNGLAFSPDEKTLYVAQSNPDNAIWMAYPVQPDGTIGAGRVFANVTAQVKAKEPGLPDGMKVDTAGNLWATGPGGVYVFAPDGAHLGTIRTGVPTANLAWGGDGSMLYITANTAVWRVQTKTTGKMP